MMMCYKNNKLKNKKNEFFLINYFFNFIHFLIVSFVIARDLFFSVVVFHRS